jgi:ectoine hydroxylase-related dioxygenase (phytanoyl-CoA dioxygenase family)
LLYQSATEITPAILRQTRQDGDSVQQPSVQAMAAGDCLIFDDRILHRGLANDSGQERWVAYFSYLRPRPGLDEIADTHFEASRSLFD